MLLFVCIVLCWWQASLQQKKRNARARGEALCYYEEQNASSNPDDLALELPRGLQSAFSVLVVFVFFVDIVVMVVVVVDMIK